MFISKTFTKFSFFKRFSADFLGTGGLINYLEINCCMIIVRKYGEWGQNAVISNRKQSDGKKFEGRNIWSSMSKICLLFPTNCIFWKPNQVSGGILFNFILRQYKK